MNTVKNLSWPPLSTKYSIKYMPHTILVAIDAKKDSTVKKKKKVISVFNKLLLYLEKVNNK